MTITWLCNTLKTVESVDEMNMAGRNVYVIYKSSGVKLFTYGNLNWFMSILIYDI